MVKPNPRIQPSKSKGKNSPGAAVKGKYATKQSVIRVGGRKISDTTIEQWNAGTNALEQKYAKARARPHAYVPMGRLGVCERCAIGEFDEIDGQFIHTGINAKLS